MLPVRCGTLRQFTDVLCARAAAMLQQPRVPPTGQRQAIEVQIKWKEVLAQKTSLLKILSHTTGHSQEKLDRVRPPLLDCASHSLLVNTPCGC